VLTVDHKFGCVIFAYYSLYVIFSTLYFGNASYYAAPRYNANIALSLEVSTLSILWQFLNAALSVEFGSITCG